MLSYKDYFNLRFRSTWTPYNPYSNLLDAGDMVGTIYNGAQYWRFKEHVCVVLFTAQKGIDKHNSIPFIMWVFGLLWRWRNA